MTVIVIPAGATTKTHEFTGISEAGRKVNVSVVASVDIEPAAVLADLQASMPGVSELGVKEWDEPGPVAVVFILFGIWFGVLGIGILFCFILAVSGFVDFYASWPNYVPIAGGESLGRGLFRLWVVGIPLVTIVLPLLLWFMAREDLEALKASK